MSDSSKASHKTRPLEWVEWIQRWHHAETLAIAVFRSLTLPGWLLAVTVNVDGGEFRLTDLRLFREGEETHLGPARLSYLSGRVPGVDLNAPLPDGLSARMMREIRLGEIEDMIRDRARDADVAFVSPEEWTAIAHRPASRGGDEKYAVIAVLYEEGLRRGERPLTAWIADQVGQSTSVTKQHIARSRERGLLTGAVVWGRKGGKASQRAREIVDALGTATREECCSGTD